MQTNITSIELQSDSYIESYIDVWCMYDHNTKPNTTQSLSINTTK